LFVDKKITCKAKLKMFTPLFKSGSVVRKKHAPNGSRAESPCGFGQSPIRLKEYFGKSENQERKGFQLFLCFVNNLLARQI
jgi:hypothetical protein